MTLSNAFHPDGRTAPYAVLGHPITHTLSPRMHNAAFRALGWNAIYLAFDVRPERTLEALNSLHGMGFGGVNITIPLKEVVLRGLSRLDSSARRSGSVNTVQFVPDGMVGHSTDGDGFLRATREAFGEGPEGRTVFILGTGGAGRAIALTLADCNVAALLLSDLDEARLDHTAREIRQQSPACPVRAVAGGEAVREAGGCDWIVQATPLGLHAGDPLPLPETVFRPGQCVYDLVYGRQATPLVAAARAAGARAETGLDMLLYQGVRAFEIWTGQTPPVDVMRNALQETSI